MNDLFPPVQNLAPGPSPHPRVGLGRRVEGRGLRVEGLGLRIEGSELRFES